MKAGKEGNAGTLCAVLGSPGEGGTSAASLPTNSQSATFPVFLRLLLLLLLLQLLHGYCLWSRRKLWLQSRRLSLPTVQQPWSPVIYKRRERLSGWICTFKCRQIGRGGFNASAWHERKSKKK